MQTQSKNKTSVMKTNTCTQFPGSFQMHIKCRTQFVAQVEADETITSAQKYFPADGDKQ